MAQFDTSRLGEPMLPHRAILLSDAMLEQIAARFRLLGEPLRLKLLAALESGERNVGELVALTGAGQANVSKHLAVLAQAGLVRRRKEGTSTYYTIADASAFTLCDIVCAGLQEHMATQARLLGMDTLQSARPAPRTVADGAEGEREATSDVDTNANVNVNA